MAADLESNESSSWYSTQELVWGVTGLGKWYRQKAEDVGAARLTADGRTIEPAVSGGELGPAWAVTRASEYDSLQLEVSDSEADPLYLMISSEGVRRRPTVRWGAHGLRVTREYLGRDFKPLNWSTHGLGDVIYTRITVDNQTRDTVRNVALVDRLPAGWEVENPRLNGNRTADRLDEDQKWNVDHMNIRDDRIELFGDLGPRDSRSVVYASRATLAGEFTIPPVSAEAMYDPSISARMRGRRITINGPWAQYID